LPDLAADNWGMFDWLGRVNRTDEANVTKKLFKRNKVEGKWEIPEMAGRFRPGAHQGNWQLQHCAATFALVRTGLGTVIQASQPWDSNIETRHTRSRLHYDNTHQRVGALCIC
jgi:hypothetical protein